jgi:hypothetical protein
MLFHALSILLAIKAKSEIGTRQLLRDLYSHQPDNCGKLLLIRTLPLLSLDEKEWLRNLY